MEDQSIAEFLHSALRLKRFFWQSMEQRVYVERDQKVRGKEKQMKQAKTKVKQMKRKSGKKAVETG